MGIFFAKCLLDKYLIDMPLSFAFLKMLCTANPYDDENERWFDGILTMEDLIRIDPSRGNFFQKLFKLIDRRNQILSDENFSDDEKRKQCAELRMQSEGHPPMKIDDLW